MKREGWCKMKLKYLTLMGVMSSLILSPISSAQSILEPTEESLLRSEVTEVEPSKLESLTQQLEALKEVPSFKMQLKLVNQRSNEKTVEVTVLGNTTTGNAIIDYDFYDRLSNPNHYHVRLYAYDNFKYAYVTTLDWLNSLDYFSQPYFKRDDALVMASIDSPVVEFEQSQLIGFDQLTSLNDAFLLLPNMNKLAQVREESIYYIDPIYTLSLERMDIPEVIFSDTKNVNLKLTTDVTINETEASAVQKLELSTQPSGLAFGALVNQQIDRTRLATIEGLDINRDLPKMDKDLGVATTMVTKKLTDFDIAFNERTQLYTLTLAGVTENFDLNIFEDKTASFKSYEFKTVYSFQPYEWTMPDLLALKSISQKELTFLMTNELIDEVSESE